jgi:dolichol-phosphate mannosyltransferase
MPDRPLVTILAPAYDEADNIVGLVGFFRRIRAAHPDLAFELLVVDDGSTDGTAELAEAVLGQGALGRDDVARVARLSRNFGSHAAVTAGLALARGDCVITVSTDLQEPLTAISEFLAQWRSGADVVWGVRRTRAQQRCGVAARLFSSVLHRFGEVPTYPKAGPSQVLLSRNVIDAVNRMPERNRNVFGIVAWVGFTQRTVAFDQLPRPAGRSKWTTGRKLRLMLDSFVEFCPAPFLCVLLGGGALAGLGLLAVVVQLVVALWGGLVGWGVVLAAVCCLGGLQLAVLGGFGEYLWRAGDEARGRPIYVLRGVQDVGAAVDKLREAALTVDH